MRVFGYARIHGHGIAPPGVSATSAPLPTPTPPYASISPDEALKLISTEGVVLLDVRSQMDYDIGHIEGAQSLPLDDLVENIDTIAPDKNTMIIVYCQCGCRSDGAAQTLINLGYANVYDLGGLDDWPYEKVPS